jgi:hypothetical protein
MSFVAGLAALSAIVAFAFWLRLPMLVHAQEHLDSDLAVDGLVLREYLRTGKLDGSYPGTPHISTLPVFLSLPATTIWGDSPASLVFAGTAATILMIVPVFLLSRKAYGIVPAIIGGFVLAAGGIGQVWLSSRVTGGHMLAAAWLAWLWWLWSKLIHSRSQFAWFGFGLICAVAFYSDRIFGVGLAAIGLATLAAIPVYREQVSGSRRFAQAFIFGWSFGAFSIVLLNIAVIGNMSTYGDQFAITTAPDAILQHIRLLFLECLPRLLLGRLLPDGSTGVTFTHPGPISLDSISAKSPLVWISLSALMAACVVRSISKNARNRTDAFSTATEVRWLWPMRVGLWMTAILTFVAFVLNRNIYNSDNYRYLVLLLPGLGMAAARLSADGSRQSLRRSFVIAFVLLLTADTVHWQTAVGFRSGFMPSPTKVGSSAASDVDLVDLLKSNPPVIDGDFEADYWEVYRALYLADLPIDRGQPFGFFPNRFFPVEPFPNSKKVPRFVVITKSPTSMQILAQIRNEGSRRVYAARNLEIFERPEAAQRPNQP